MFACLIEANSKLLKRIILKFVFEIICGFSRSSIFNPTKTLFFMMISISVIKTVRFHLRLKPNVVKGVISDLSVVALYTSGAN